MIIQIRGTSGSGKTWAMKQVMESMQLWQAEAVINRKRPLYYRSCSERPLTYLMGHYETPCGGCDSLGSARSIHDWTSWLLSGERPVPRFILQEGLLLSEDVKWTKEMHEKMGGVFAFFLITPLERCLEQIVARRASVGNEKPLNPTNTQNRLRTIERARQKLVEAGVPCCRCAVSQVPGLVLNFMRESCKT